MKKIDSHYHLWDLSLKKHSWLLNNISQTEITLLGDYHSICHNYPMEDYLQEVQKHNVEKSVHVQAGWDNKDPIGETSWLQKIADKYGHPHGIVGYADLSSPEIEQVLEAHCEHKNVRGIRQPLRWHEDILLRGAPKNYLVENSWIKNYALLEKYKLSFDMLLYPHQMQTAAKLVKTYPTIQVIIEHLGEPIDIYDNSFNYWKTQLSLLAELPNTSIKISGFGMLNNKLNIDVIRPYVETAISLFGTDRCMFGSNIPVSSLYGDSNKIYNIADDILARYSAAARTKIYYTNAARIYRL